jgi:hypothetical protein
MVKNIFKEIDKDFKYKYGLTFNTNLLPPNFNKYKLIIWDEIDHKNIIINNSIKYLDFSHSTFVIIESLDNQIYLYIGGVEYLIKKSILFFPILIGTHNVCIGLIPNIKIYTSSIFELDNNYHIESKKLFNILVTFNSIYFNIYDKNYKNILVSRYGMYGYTTKKNLEFVDENILYSRIENDLKDKNYDINLIYNEIYFIDKYIQSDIIKIVKENC